jgi:hypothetical protein
MKERNMPATSNGTLSVVLIFLPLIASAQSRPDFSGNWVLVSATATGTRGGDSTDERPITSNTASGAAFNCGRECTLEHKEQAVMIDKALLGSNPDPAPAVTLQLNGREASVLDSFNPPRKIPVTAQWNGNKLEIASKGLVRTITQLVSIEGSELVVVISSGSEQPRVTLKYKKK